MTDTENVFDGFALLGDDEEFDVDKIFGSGSDDPAPPPPSPALAEEVKSQPEPKQVQTETPALQPEPKQTLPAKTQEVPAEEKQPLELFSAFTSAESDPIPEAATVKSIAPRPQTQLSLFDKPPVFQYGGAREQITDPDMTFEALRIQKADDFPELEDASAVTWQVRYGDITKAIPTPKTDTSHESGDREIQSISGQPEKRQGQGPGVRRKAADPDAEEGYRGLQGRIPDAGGCARIQQGHLPHPLAGWTDV